MKMRKYIDADKAIKNYARYGISHFYDATDLEAILNECPAADVQEIRRGRWIRDEFGSRCGACGLYAYRDKFDKPWESPYCPNCGAKMDEVSE